MKKTIVYLSLAVFFSVASVIFWRVMTPKPMFRVVTFNQLPGWGGASLEKSLSAFHASCRAFIKQDPEQFVGTDDIALKVKDWIPACEVALKINPTATAKAKQFFQEWFSPVEFYRDQPTNGLFTGYYMPLIKGSLTKTDEFSVPIYEVPKDLVTIDLGLFSDSLKNKKIMGRLENNKLVPYYTREQINNGAIKGKALVLLWIHSPIDRLFLEIQGSGVIELETGERLYIGYNGQNGAPYTAIAGVLIKKGVMTKENASMQGIKRYLEANPEQIASVINQNKSFIFFRKLHLDGALGSQGVALTPGYSLAVDKKWVPMGTPIWLSTSRPDSTQPNLSKPMKRLMVAQDTGGAIKGKVRGDVFWGGGEKATLIAGHMKNSGHYWLLLPRQAAARLNG